MIGAIRFAFSLSQAEIMTAAARGSYQAFRAELGHDAASSQPAGE
jgi:hypothetical protein